MSQRPNFDLFYNVNYTKMFTLLDACLKMVHGSWLKSNAWGPGPGSRAAAPPHPTAHPSRQAAHPAVGQLEDAPANHQRQGLKSLVSFPAHIHAPSGQRRDVLPASARQAPCTRELAATWVRPASGGRLRALSADPRRQQAGGPHLQLQEEEE